MFTSVRFFNPHSALRNVSHRHEPPVTSTPVRIILHDKERQFIVIDKPGSIVSRLSMYAVLNLTSLYSQYTLREDTSGTV